MKISSIFRLFRSFKDSRTVKNSLWGVISSGAQNVLLSLYFIILARKYDPSIFALFLIASNIYQVIVSFSSLGLGQWFTRTFVGSENKADILNKFLKIQLFSGIFFYVVAIILGYLLYDSQLIRYLTIILGTNIIFDNIIYGIKALNVAEFQQRKTFTILFIDAMLKFLVASILLFYPIDILVLTVLLVITRLITLNIFLRYGTSNILTLRSLISQRISKRLIMTIVLPNWPFIVIGSISVIYWRIGNFIVSKALPLTDVANYEVSYKVYSLTLIVPLVLSMTVFPTLVEKFKAKDMEKFKAFATRVSLIYLVYGLLVYTFFYSFSDLIIPLLFGEKFVDNAIFTRQMFLTILVFPTAYLQANIIVAINKEKVDMALNILSLVINVLMCVVGLYFYKSLTVIYVGIFTSFLVFHIVQDFFLVRKRIYGVFHAIRYYLVTATTVLLYVYLARYFNQLIFFFVFWLTVSLLVLSVFFIRRRMGKSNKGSFPVM